MAAAFDFADKNQVVALGVAAAVAAVKVGDGPGNQRRAGQAAVPGHAGKAVDVFGGELAGQGLMFGPQHIDGVVAAAAQHLH